MIPNGPVYNIKEMKLPAKVYIKLWSNNPKNINETPDITFVLEMI